MFTAFYQTTTKIPSPSYWSFPLPLHSNHSCLLTVLQKLLVPFTSESLCIYCLLPLLSHRYPHHWILYLKSYSDVIYSVQLLWPLYLNLKYMLSPTLPTPYHLMFVNNTYYLLICYVIFLFSLFIVSLVCARIWAPGGQGFLSIFFTALASFPVKIHGTK